MFRAVTYNVHGCVGRDGRYAPERIAGLVRDFGAGVVALQESWRDQAGDLLACLGKATDLAPLDGTPLAPPAGRCGNLLLTRHPVIEHRSWDLSVPGREQRCLIDAKVRIEGRAWRVLVTHLGLSFSERRKQFARIASLLADDSGPALLMGDFNVWAGHGAFGPLRRAGFRQQAVASFPTWLRPFLSLDRILVRSPGRILRSYRHASPAAKVASDHFPVIAHVGS